MNRVEECNLRGLGRNLVLIGAIRPNEGQKQIEDVKIRGLLTGPVEPDFIEASNGHFFDIRKQKDEKEIAKVFIEEAPKNAGSCRVTTTEPITENGQRFSKYNIHSEAERTGTLRIYRLAELGYNLAIWISPEDGAKEVNKKLADEMGLVYMDGRLNIQFSRKNEKGEIEVWGKHLPLDINRFKAMELADRLLMARGQTIGEINKVDDLRVQPIGFRLEDGDDWVAKCRELMPELENYWALIERGDDIKEQKEVERKVRKALEIAKGDNYVFQKEMARQGQRINQGGRHGVDYGENELSRVMSYEIKMIDGKAYVEPQLNDRGELICPVCGAIVKSSDSICHLCGINLLQKKD